MPLQWLKRTELSEIWISDTFYKIDINEQMCLSFDILHCSSKTLATFIVCCFLTGAQCI